MSRALSDRGLEHVVLERGRVVERWRSERWDSLRLLTPNWLTRLPGYRYQGSDPDGFMTMPEVVRFFEGYAATLSAPVETETTVLAVEPIDAGYRVTTDNGMWVAANVVIATGACDQPLVPPAAARLSSRVLQLVPTRYRRAEQLPPGGVLVVGASASGVQLADELQRAGRQVTLAVGRYTRVPRTYRGRDIFWWLDRAGILDEGFADVRDVEASRRSPSMQLVGQLDRRSVDLPTLARRGVELVGRAVAADGERVCFSGDLAETASAADAKLGRLLARIDGYVARAGLSGEVEPAERIEPTPPLQPRRSVHLAADGINSVIWATGFRRRYPWLKGARGRRPIGRAGSRRWRDRSPRTLRAGAQAAPAP